MSNKKEAVFFIESQPPHLGELVAVLFTIDNFAKMHVCVSGIPQVVPIPRVMATWHFLLRKYQNKTTVSALLINFDMMPELPERFKHCTVLTTSPKVLVHMTSIGVDAELVPKVLGYCGTFQRTAYRQGRALDYLLANGAKMVENIINEGQK